MWSGWRVLTITFCLRCWSMWTCGPWQCRGAWTSNDTRQHMMRCFGNWSAQSSGQMLTAGSNNYYPWSSLGVASMHFISSLSPSLNKHHILPQHWLRLYCSNFCSWDLKLRKWRKHDAGVEIIKVDLLSNKVKKHVIISTPGKKDTRKEGWIEET